MDREITRLDNQPPLEDRLALDHADLVKRAAEAVALVPADLRAIGSDEEAAAYTDTAADLKKILKEADDAFEPEKKPWLAGGRTVDNFFAFRATLKAKADAVVRTLNAFATAKLNAQRKADAEAAEKARKEAIAFDEPAPASVAAAPARDVVRVVAFSGAKASASVKWDYRITDFDAVPRELLMENRPAITAAIAGLKARGLDIKDAKLAGIEIFEAVKTSIRR